MTSSTLPEEPALPEGPAEIICSAKACQQAAAWALQWNNPRIHTPERRKTWLACDDHRQHLSHFLQARSFLRDVVPLPEFDGDLGGR